LKHLAKLNNTIDSNPNALAAARITKPGVGSPAINDVLEILKKLAKILNKIDIPYLDDVKFERTPIELKKDEKHILRHNYSGKIRFESLNSNVAAVNSNGQITAIGRGNANICIWVDDILRIVYNVRVVPTTTSIKITNIPQYISRGELYKLNIEVEPKDTVDKTEFIISDNSKAKIQDGIKAVWHTPAQEGTFLVGAEKGSFTLTVKSGNVSQSYTVTVEIPTLSNYKLTLVEGESNTLKVGDTKQKAEWRSSNPSVATVDQNGNVRALKAGYTCIIVKIGQTERYCDVNVITAIEKRIDNLKKKYPQGYYWNKNTPDSQFPSVSSIPCNHPAGVRNCIGQCAGFAHLISNEVFGNSAPRHRITDLSKVKPGDYIRYSNGGNHRHSILITKVVKEGDIIGYNSYTANHIYASSTYWVITHCNWMSDCGIDWDMRFTPSYMKTFISSESYSRY
jgi:uncharacterized protein YjdB